MTDVASLTQLWPPARDECISAYQIEKYRKFLQPKSLALGWLKSNKLVLMSILHGLIVLVRPKVKFAWCFWRHPWHGAWSMLRLSSSTSNSTNERPGES